MSSIRKKIIALCAVVSSVVIMSSCAAEKPSDLPSSNSNSQTSTDASNSTGEQKPTESSNFIDFGKDLVGYNNQDKVSGLYNIGIFTVTENAKFTSTAGEKTLDGKSFSMACQIGASATPFSSKSITFSASSVGKITVYAIIGSSGKELGQIQLFNSSNQVVSTVDITNTFAKYEIEITAPGKYALSPTSIASINVYAIDFSGQGVSNSSSNTQSSGGSSSGGSSTSPTDSSLAGLTAAEQAIVIKANNAMTWQIPNVGGWDKGYDMHIANARGSNAYNKSSGWKAKNGGYMGTIDNGATYGHMKIIAQAYAITGEQKYKDSFALAINFLKNLQTKKGGFTQVYPKRGSYSDYVTFNDDAMVSVMKMLRAIYEKKAPYNTDIVSESERTQMKAMFDKGVEYILAAQIEIDGVKTAWCAQHDPETYAPKEARAYERPSISGSESVGIIELLMSLTDNAAAQEAGMCAVRWFDEHKVVGKAFNKNGEKNPVTGEIEYIYDKPGSVMWYRFYDFNGVGFVSDQKTNKKWQEYNGYFYDINEISEERRTGYAWFGNWPSSVINKYLK